MPEPLTQRARTEAATSGAAAAQGQLPNRLPPELKLRLYSFLDPEDRQALSRASKPTRNAVGRREERERLQSLADRLKSNPNGMFAALIARLKYTMYPNRRTTGVVLSEYPDKDNLNLLTESTVQKAVSTHIALLAPESLPNAERDPFLATLLLEVLDAVFLPDTPDNAPKTRPRKDKWLFADKAHESFRTEKDNQDRLLRLTFEATGNKRTVQCEYLKDDVVGLAAIQLAVATFEGTHPTSFVSREGGWGLAHRLAELRECTNWKRETHWGINSYETLITALILHSGMFHVRPPNDINPAYQMYISSGFADACAGY